MTDDQARKLKIGDRVQTNDVYMQPVTAGTVIETGYNAVKVKWDDGIIGICHHNDCEWFDEVQS